MKNLTVLSHRIKALTVFRALLEDRVIKALNNYLDSIASHSAGAISKYADLVSAIYNSDCEDLASHIKHIACSCENVYSRMIGLGKTPDEYLSATLTAELETLQQVADLTPEALCEGILDGDYLPRFKASRINIEESFMHRAANISKYGYGIYTKHRMFCINSESEIIPVKNPDKIKLCELIDYEAERKIILDNTKALLLGKPAANILITGDAGTGKSSTVKAVANELFDDGLRIIEVRKSQLEIIPHILDELAQNPLKFILFIDDLSFLKDDDNFNSLKAVLEGSVSAKSKNVVIYATSNRRHIIKEKFSDREGDEVHRNDTMQEMISLSERFGLHVTFGKPDKKTFLNIVHSIARENNIRLDESELDLLAERFALERGGRSARLARQFIDNILTKEI